MGTRSFLEDDEFCIIQREIPKEEIKKEVNRFREALTKTRSEMLATQEKIHKTLGKEYARLADAYLLILEDPLITRDVVKEINEGVNAESHAFQDTRESHTLVRDDRRRVSGSVSTRYRT